MFLFFFNDPATTEIYPLSLHDALPISRRRAGAGRGGPSRRGRRARSPDARRPPRPASVWASCPRSEEHTSELQSRPHLVCRLLLEKKKNTYSRFIYSSTLSCACVTWSS